MSQKIIPHRYKLKRAKAEVAQKLNPLLLEGEPIVITQQTKKGPVTRLKIGDGKTLYNELSFFDVEGSGIIEITEPCHIATLDVGTYMIRGINSGDNGKVILKNVTEDKTVDEELLTITDGLLLITSNVKNIVSEDDIGDVEECLVTFTAQGLISDPLNLYLKNNRNSITVNNLRIIKAPVSENDFIEGNWYTYDNIIIEEPIYQYVDELHKNIIEERITPLEEYTREHVQTAQETFNELGVFKEATTEALTTLEKGTITTLDTVNIWELEAGVYYVNTCVYYATPNPPVYPNSVEMQSEKGLLYVHVNRGNNNRRDFYLFANGNIYVGYSVDMAGINAEGKISSVVAAIKNEITSENVDGIPTKKAVYNFGETIKTELLTDIGNKADRTEVETVLSGKVNKSDVLSNIDKNAQPQQIYNAPVINTTLAKLEKDTIKPAVSVDLTTCESGVYLTSEIIYKKSIDPQSFTQIIPDKGILVVDKTEVGICFYWLSPSYIFAGCSNTAGQFENDFTEYQLNKFATKDNLNTIKTELQTNLDTLKTELQGNIDTKADNTETEAALDGKVNKSDILSSLDFDAAPKDIYNAPTVNNVLSTFNDTITSINERLTAIDGVINEVSALVGGA